jgi:hypothetical protein
MPFICDDIQKGPSRSNKLSFFRHLAQKLGKNEYNSRLIDYILIFFELWGHKVPKFFDFYFVQKKFGSKRDSNPRPRGHEVAALSLHYRGLLKRIFKPSTSAFFKLCIHMFLTFLNKKFISN